MTDKNNPDSTESVNTPASGRSTRRRLLKTTGVATGAIATASIWQKPLLDSLVIPAHAQTSVDDMDSGNDMGSDNDMDPPPTEKVLSGPTSANSPASARLAAPSFNSVSAAFVSDNETDYQHCLTLTIPNVSAPSTITVRIDGPDIYHDYDGYYSSTSYYTNITNFSGSANTTLTQSGNDFDFSVNINGLEISGTVDQSLNSATGALFNSSGPAQMDLSGANGYGAFMHNPEAGSNSGADYGAYWSTSENSQCMVGSGPTQAVYYGPNPD